MNKLYLAIWCEFAKLKHSKVFNGTIALFFFLPLMMGFMVYVVQHPEISAKLGIIAVKASVLGGANWPAFMNLILQLISTLGFIGFGFVTAWVFGSEHTENTLKDIIAMPISRGHIVTAKFVTSFLWCLLLSIILIAISIFVGKFMNLSGWSLPMILKYTRLYFLATFLTLTLCPPIAFLANYGKGIIAPLAFVLITMIMAQFTVYMGLGPYFPWAIPALSIMPIPVEGMQITSTSYIILGSTFILGWYGTKKTF